MRFFLEKIQRTEGSSLKELIDKAGVGERIVLFQGICTDWSLSYNLDFYHEENCVLYCNGNPVFEGLMDEWDLNDLGFVVRSGNKFLQNGVDLLCDCENEDWATHKEGVVIIRRDTESGGDDSYEVVLNNKKVLWRGSCGSYPTISAHPLGFTVNPYGDAHLINGVREFVTHKQLRKVDSWMPWGNRDFVLYKKPEFLMCGGRVMHRAYCDAWQTHPHGLVLETASGVALVVLEK